MAKEATPRSGRTGRSIVLVIAALLCVATVVLAVWALSPAKSDGLTGDDGADDVGTDDEPDDGGTSTPIDEPKGPFLEDMVFVYNTTQEAGEAMDEIKDLSIDLWENLTWNQVGEASVMGDYNYFGYLLGKTIIFQQDHFVCAMHYYAYTDEPGDVTDEMMLEMANLQLSKIL